VTGVSSPTAAGRFADAARRGSCVPRAARKPAWEGIPGRTARAGVRAWVSEHEASVPGWPGARNGARTACVLLEE